MRRSSFSDAEIISFVREIEAGRPAAEVARATGTSLRTLSRWRRNFGGLKPFAVRRLRDLERENHRLRSEIAPPAPVADVRPAPGFDGPAAMRSDLGDGRSRLDATPSGPATVVGRYAALRLR